MMGRTAAACDARRADETTMPTPLVPHFRLPRGDADADALVAIRQECADADGYDPLSTVEGLPTREDLLAQLRAAVSGQERWLLVEFNNEVIAYGRIGDWTEGDGMCVWLHLGWVRPAWRNKGVGTALLRELEGRIRTLAEGAPRWEFAANAAGTEPAATQLLLDNGYHVAYTVLEMALAWDAFDAAAPAVWPAEFTLRPATAEDVPAIAHSVAEAYRNEYPADRYHEPTDEVDYAAELAAPRFDRGLFQVAWAGDEVAGQVIPLIERGRAEIYEVSVRPAYRRRGLARALLARQLDVLRARGVAIVRLHTMAEFPTRAVDLYRDLGFETVKVFPRYRKPS
jgi:ribosomal protein S18 acetylase RimI-like enzyme